MAIKLSMNWRGAELPAAYIRVESVRGGKRENRPLVSSQGEAVWVAQFGVYAREGEAVPLFAVDVITPFDAEVAPFPALYSALKAAPEFAGAVDC